MSNVIVTVVEGSSREPVKTFTGSVVVNPFGVGSSGEWSISGPLIAPVHAYLYFDGVTLHVSAIQADNSTTINGTPITSTWTPAPAPAEIKLGGVKLFVKAADDASTKPPPAPAADDAPQEMQDMQDAKTAYFSAVDEISSQNISPSGPVPQMPPAAGVPAPRPSQRRAPPSDEATAYRPIQAQLRDGTGPHPALSPQPGAPTAPPGAPLGSGPMPGIGGPTMPGLPPGPGAPLQPPPGVVLPQDGQMPGQMPGMPPVQPPAQPPAEGGFKAAWQSASGPKKAIYVLLPFALIGAAYTILVDDEPQPGKKASAKASASASASSAPEAASAAPALSTEPPRPSETGPLLPTAPVAVASVGPKPPRPGQPPPKSIDRQAVDAVAAGNYAEAARLYEQLSKEKPDVPAYREAARILKIKASGGK